MKSRIQNYVCAAVWVYRACPNVDDVAGATVSQAVLGDIYELGRGEGVVRQLLGSTLDVGRRGFGEGCISVLIGLVLEATPVLVMREFVLEVRLERLGCLIDGLAFRKVVDDEATDPILDCAVNEDLVAGLEEM